MRRTTSRRDVRVATAGPTPNAGSRSKLTCAAPARNLEGADTGFDRSANCPDRVAGRALQAGRRGPRSASVLRGVLRRALGGSTERRGGHGRPAGHGHVAARPAHAPLHVDHVPRAA